MTKKRTIQTKIATLLLTLALCVSGFVLIPMKVAAEGTTHVVQSNDDLQAIIDAANEGDSIDITAMTTLISYNSWGTPPDVPYKNYTINKSLTIIGQGTYEWHKGYWQRLSRRVLLNMSFKLENNATLTLKDGYYHTVATTTTVGPAKSMISGQGNVKIEDTILNPLATASYATAEPTINVDGNVTVDGTMTDAPVSGYDKYYTTQIYGTAAANGDSSIQSGYAGTCIKASGTVTILGGKLEAGVTAHPKMRGGNGIEAKDVIIDGETILHATQARFYNKVQIWGGDSTAGTGIMPGNGIVASGDVIIKGGFVRGGHANTQIEHKENPDATGGVGIITQGNVTMEGKFIEYMGKTFHSAYIQGTRAAYQTGIPIVMNGSRDDGPKTFTMKTALIWSESASNRKYDAPYDVQMDNNDIAFVEDSKMGWYYNLPLFSGGQVSIKNPRAIYGTLENVTSYKINQLLKGAESLVESNYTVDSWKVFQDAVDKIGDSFYKAGDEISSQTLMAAVVRMNDLEDEIDAAIKGLKLAGADYSKVYAAIAKIPADLSIYTDESVQVVLDAKDAVVYGKNIAEQAIVDGYATTIETAITNLVKKAADYSKVYEAIAKIPADLSIYTDESVQVVLDAKDAVVYGKDITEQVIVDGYATAIEDAIKALVKKPIIESGKDLDEKPTTPDSTNSSSSVAKSASSTNTGDNTTMTLFVFLGFASGITLLSNYRKTKKKHF